MKICTANIGRQGRNTKDRVSFVLQYIFHPLTYKFEIWQQNHSAVTFLGLRFEIMYKPRINILWYTAHLDCKYPYFFVFKVALTKMWKLYMGTNHYPEHIFSAQDCDFAPFLGDVSQSEKLSEIKPIFVLHLHFVLDSFFLSLLKLGSCLLCLIWMFLFKLLHNALNIW